MIRAEYGFRPSQRQLIFEEVGSWFAKRDERLARVIINNHNILPCEKVQITTFQTELSALREIVASELFLLDAKIAIALKAIEQASKTG